MNDNDLQLTQINLLKSLSSSNLAIPENGNILPYENLKTELGPSQIRLYKIDEIAFDDDYPRREAFENVIQSMSEMDGYNLVYILEGNKRGINLYLGAVWNKNNEKNEVQGKAKGLVTSFLGNFNGSKVSALEYDELQGIISQKYSNAGVITGIPSINEEKNDLDFQGIDRLINSMLGLEWRVAVVCEAVSRDEVLEQQEKVYELYKQLNLYKNTQIQYRKDETKKESDVETASEGLKEDRTDNQFKNRDKKSVNGSGSEYRRKETDTVNGREKRHSIDEFENHTNENNKQEIKEKNYQESYNFELINKRAMEVMKYIDDEFLNRLKIGSSKGMFKTSLYYMANNPDFALRLQKNIISLFQGNKVTYSPLQARQFTREEISNLNILNTFRNYSSNTNGYDLSLVLTGRPFDAEKIGLCTYLTTQEVSIIAGLPQKEVPGIALKTAVSFGLNEEKKDDNKEYIEIGHFVQKGRTLDIPFYLKKDSFSKHIFIAGTTGSGKTTTCHTLIKRAKMPFLVIEPAKTEYRCLINKMDVAVFTLGNEQVAPFRLNPFELIKGEIISSHVDMVKAAFTSAFPMEAAMPQILEEAIYKCYENKGWNIYTNENELYEDPFDPNVNSFPVMSDLIAEMSEVVNTEGFDDRLKNEYIGSLVARFRNLTIGSKGAMLNCFHSTSFDYIATHNVIMELEGLRSQEDKSLMMGFILARLSSQIRLLHDEYKKDGKEFRHLTFVEEAHRLLSKVEPGDSGSKKTGVETFCDLLAEVRKYGEGLVIVDQIPNKLASEVLKNTNTKIIQKLFAQDDKDAVGNAMLMDDEQRKYISALSTGQAIVFTETTAKPVHVQISQLEKTDGIDPEDIEVKNHFDNKKQDLGSCYAIPELMQLAQKDFLNIVRDIKGCEFNSDLRNKFLSKIKDISQKNNLSEDYIFEQLINAYDAVSGNAMRGFEDASERISNMNKLFEIYRNNFEKLNADFVKDGDDTLFTKAPRFFLKTI